MVIGRILAFSILSSIKVFTQLFYKMDFHWSPEKTKDYFNDIRLIAFLNHTSLYEPMFVCALPFSFIWKITGHSSIPGANITLSRPIVGFFWKMMLPKITSITRKKDDTWNFFLNSIEPNDVIMITPEGCMKRPNGLDKHGKKMKVRGGIADILERIDDGYMLVALSGGLHHIQKPGQHIPKLFKRISMNVVRLNIKEYKSRFEGSAREVKLKVVEDLQRRLENDCPSIISV